MRDSSAPIPQSGSRIELPAIATAVLECMTEGVSVTTEDGIIVYTNPAEDRMFGYAPGELTGQHVTVQNAWPPEENQRRVGEVLHHLSIHGLWAGDWHNRRKDGSTFYTSSRICGMEAAGQRFWLCVQRDITQERLREIEARELAERADTDRRQLRAVLDNLTQCVIVFDTQGKAIDANPAAAKVHGFSSAAEMLVRLSEYADLLEVHDLRGNPVALPQWPATRALAGEAARDCELQVRRRDTDAQWVGSYNATPIRNEAGEIIRVVLSMHDLTERQRANAALHESEARFRMLIHAMPQLAWITRPDGYSEFANQRWLDYTGQTLEESCGRGWSSALHPDDLARIIPLWDESLSTGKVFEANYRIRRASDGEYRWHLTLAVPLRDEQGRITRWFGTNTDVEDQLRTETALRETASRLSLAMSASRMGDWSWEPHSDRLTLSEMAATICGVPPGASLTWTAMRQLIHTDERDRARRSVEHAILRRSDYDDEYRMQVNGTWRWVAVRGRASYSPEGEVTGMLGILQDVTDRRNAEAELAAARDHATSILENITDAFFALDPEWRFTYVNREAERVLARPRAELLGKAIWEEFAPAVGTPFWHNYQRAMNERVFIQFEANYEPLDTWFDVRAYPTNTGLAVYFQDVNDRRRLQADREAALARLEQSNEELRRANADLEQFAFAAAHDLQEPLRMVTSYTQLLERRLPVQPDPRSRQYMEYIVAGAQRMSMLLADLLAYTETARGKSDPSPVELDQVVAESLENLARPVAESEARVVVATGLPVVSGRQGHFVQLFQNLIGNAIKYRRPDVPPEITVTCEPQGDSEWLITVADNGIGIDPAWHQQIFGVFRRLHGRDIPGTGIGLAICQRVVERAGGQIWVESEGGKGSRFRFTLPRT